MPFEDGTDTSAMGVSLYTTDTCMLYIISAKYSWQHAEHGIRLAHSH